MNDLFARRRQKILQLKIARESGKPNITSRHVPKAFEQCTACGEAIPGEMWTQGLFVCPRCGFHSPIGAYQRLSMVLDPGTFREMDALLAGTDPLAFPGYEEKLARQRSQTGLCEAVVTARGKIGGHHVIIAVLDSRFFMGSMGVALGEKITRAAEAAKKAKLPLIVFCASGGARMQEGILSLMQMAKTVAALERFQAAGGLYISYLTHPTTGGVTASFGSLGDITLAEPGALIGFAGPRVIEQTIGETLPAGFQRAEYLEAHGFVDAVVPRSEMKDTLAQLLRLHKKGRNHHAGTKTDGR